MKMIAFSNLFAFQRKSSIKAGDGLKNGKFPFYSSSNVLSKYINEYLFDMPSLIFGTGGQASIHFCDTKFNVSTDCVVAQVKNENECCPKFVFYYLNGNIYLLEREFKGAGLKHISKNDIDKIQIPLPPLPEQKRIAAILDKADALRQKNKQLLAAYDELLQATFLELFGDPVTNPKGWKEEMLDSTIKKIQIGPFGSQLHKSDYLEYGIPLINPTNIKENKISIDEAACISEEKYNSMPQYHLFDGDVVMARRGDLSKVALVRQNGGKMFCGTGSLYIRFSEELNKFFLFKLLSNEKTINFLEKEARGVTMPNLNKSIIKRIPIFLPPIALQNQFARIVENIEAQKAILKQSIQESEDLFNGLVQKAFNGEL